jgi:hypothetical protein
LCGPQKRLPPTPSRTRKGVTAQQDGPLRHFRGVPFGLGRVGAARNLERKGGTSPPQNDGSEWNRGPHVPKRNVRSPPTLRDLTTDRRTLNRTQVRKSRRRAGGKGKPGETQSQSRRQRQGTVLFLSYVEEQKLRFQGGSHSAALRDSFRLASSKVAGPFRVGAGGAPTSDVGRSHNGQAPPPPSRTLSPNWTVGRSAVERHRLLRVERRPGSYPVLTLILRSRQSPAPSTAPDLLQIVTPVAISFLFL